MKKFVIIILAVLVIGIGYSFLSKPTPSTQTATTQNQVPSGVSTPLKPEGVDVVQPGENPNEETGNVETEDSELADEVRPASVAFKNSEEALVAIKKAAADYDDIILEQFTMPGDDCTWCPEFYSSVRDMLSSPDIKNEEKSYYAELLAVSGKTENVGSLIEGFKVAKNDDEREVFSAALELVTGKDDVVEFLGTQLHTDNDSLRESVVAAITNQGSTLALDTLYKYTAEKGDPDGFYSQGIGVGEMILDDSALSKAQEYAQKRDAFSPLAVKALLNSGLNGLRIVMDILANSPDAEADKNLIKGAVAHVSYDEQIQTYLETLKNAPQPLVRDFTSQVLNDFNQQEEPDAADGEADTNMSLSTDAVDH